VTVTERTEPIDVDTVVTGEWIITLNADREIYWDGAIAVSGGVITEIGKRAAILAKYRPAALIDEPGSIVIPGMINGHRHLLCCAKGAMPEGGQTLSALRQFIYPSFAALTEDDMHVYARDVEAVISSGARISQNPTSALKLAKGTTQTGKWKELAALLPRDSTRDPNAISAEQALEMATLGGAPALRMQDQVGSLETGKQADIVVFDTANFDLRPLHNPVANIVYGSTGHSVDTVLIGGEIVLRHKQLTSLDEQELRRGVEAINRRVLGEIGIAPLPKWPVI